MVPKHHKAPGHWAGSWPWPLTSEQSLRSRSLQGGAWDPSGGEHQCQWPRHSRSTSGAPKGRLPAPARVFYWDREQTTGLGATHTPLPLLATPAPVPPCVGTTPACPQHLLTTLGHSEQGTGWSQLSLRGCSLPSPHQPCPAQPGSGTFSVRPAPGWVGCLDGRRDALGRQKSLLWEAHREGDAVQGRGGRGGQGGVTWCPRPGSLRRPSSLPPPSSGRPC